MRYSPTGSPGAKSIATITRLSSGQAMSISIQEVKTRRAMKQFIYLPEKIHRNHPGWVPPFYSDDKKTFDPGSNPAYAYCESMCALAMQEDEPVGRIAGIINHRYNKEWKRRDARFGYLECPGNREVAHALLNFVEEWASKKGMSAIVGPMGFTEEDPEGYLIEGYEHPPNLATYYNFEYLPRLLEEEGYTKEVEYVVYTVVLARAISDFYRKAYQRVSRRQDFRLVEFSSKKEIKLHIRPIFRLMNECFRNIYGYSSLDEIEMDRLANRYLPIIDPRFIKIVVDNNNSVIGFIIGIPSIADGIRKAGGRLYPFGIIKILKSLRQSKKLDLYLGGIQESYRGKGVDVLLGYSMMTSAIDAGFQVMDSHHELETNMKMRAEMERVSGTVYKRFRIYRKSLT